MTHHSRSHSVAGGREWHGGRNNSVRRSTLRIIGLAIRGCLRIDLKMLLALLIPCGLLTAVPLGQAFEDHSAPIQQPPSQPGDASEKADDQYIIRTLEPGKSIQRELAGRQQHTYQIWLNADQFLKVIVEQNGVDVIVLVSGPGGKQILKFDSESRPGGQESVSLVAEAAGEYRLIVQSQ